MIEINVKLWSTVTVPQSNYLHVQATLEKVITLKILLPMMAVMVIPEQVTAALQTYPPPALALKKVAIQSLPHPVICKD